MLFSSILGCFLGQLFLQRLCVPATAFKLSKASQLQVLRLLLYWVSPLLPCLRCQAVLLLCRHALALRALGSSRPTADQLLVMLPVSGALATLCSRPHLSVSL